MKKGTMWAAIALSMMASVALSGCSSDSNSQEPELIIDPVMPPITTTMRHRVRKSFFIVLIVLYSFIAVIRHALVTKASLP